MISFEQIKPSIAINSNPEADTPQVPQAIWTYIFSYVPWTDHAHIALTCRRFRSLTALVPFLHLWARVHQQDVNQLPPILCESFCLYLKLPLAKHLYRILNDYEESNRSVLCQRVLALHQMDSQPMKELSAWIVHNFYWTVHEHSQLSRHGVLSPLTEAINQLLVFLESNPQPSESTDWAKLNEILKLFYTHSTFIQDIKLNKNQYIVLRLSELLKGISPEQIQSYAYVLLTRGMILFSFEALVRDENYKQHIPWDIPFCRQLIKADDRYFQVFPPAFRANREIALFAAENHKNATAIVDPNYHPLQYAAAQSRDDEEIMLAGLRRSLSAWRLTSLRLRRNPDFIIKAVSRNPNVFVALSKKYQQSDKICLAALTSRNIQRLQPPTCNTVVTLLFGKKKPLPVDFPLAKIFKNYPNLIYNQYIIKFYDRKLLVETVIQTLIKTNNFYFNSPRNLLLVHWLAIPEELRNDRFMITLALKTAFKNPNSEYRATARELIQRALQTNCFITAIRRQEDSCSFAHSFLQPIFDYNTRSVYIEGVLALREDRDFIAEIASFNIPIAYALASEELKNAIDFWVALYLKEPRQLPAMALFFDHTHRLLWQGLLSANGMLLEIAPEYLKDDIECVLLARRTAGNQALQFASPRLLSGINKKHERDIEAEASLQSSEQKQRTV